MQDTTVAQNLSSAEIVDEVSFLQATVPSDGVKFITEWLPKQEHPRGGVMIHHACGTHAEMLERAKEVDARGRNAYFALASFKEVEYKTKGNFTYTVGRRQGNVLWLKALWMDLDVGKSTPDSYDSQVAAASALKTYVNATGLPNPMIISSGYGLHSYWIFTEKVSPREWESIAKYQRSIMRHLGVKFDPSRDVDCASLLRPVGTHNHKPEKPAQPVKVVRGKVNALPAEEYERLLLSYVEKHAISVPSVANDAGMPSINCDLIVSVEYPPSDANLVAEKCKQVALFRETGGESEPIWYASLGLLKHCVDGEKYAHEWSAKHPDYDAQATLSKMDQWDFGPPTCDKFKSINPSACDGCVHICTSPIQLGVDVAKQALPEWLVQMNKSYAWIEQVAGVYRLPFRDFITMDKFHAAHANDTEEIVSGQKITKVSRSRLWLSHEKRAQYLALVTRPGEPVVTADNCLNEWAGFSVQPIAGDVTPFKKLYAYLFGNEQFPLLWLAHLIQFPGIKMFVALVVWSKQEGVGKNLLFEAIGNLFDPRHFALIGQSEVDDDFCGWIPGTVFMLGDEIRASKSEKARDRLKLWGTATTLRTHDKGQPKRVVENLMNQVYLSNHADGMFLSDYDRRFWVHEVKTGPLPESLKNEYLRWRDNGGLAHLLHYLKGIDLEGFDPKGRAPVTDSKKDMIEAGRSDLDRWAIDIVNGALPVGQEVATAERMTTCFMEDYPHVRTAPSVSTVAKVLVRAGAYRRENQIRLKDGRKVRALALVRADHWKDQPEAAWRNELEKRR